jgi:hypothetical protein
MLSLTLATLRSYIFYVIGRCSTGNESVLVFDFGILHRDEALVARHIFSTESGFAISPSAIPIKDHTDSVDGMCRSFCQLLNLVGLQEQSRSFRDWYSLHPRFDDRTSELALEVGKVAVLKFRQFARRAYLTLGECRIRQDSDYKNARYDRGIVSPLLTMERATSSGWSTWKASGAPTNRTSRTIRCGRNCRLTCFLMTLSCQPAKRV